MNSFNLGGQQKEKLTQYLLQSLNMALSSIIQGETSYTNSFDCQVRDEGFYCFVS